MASGNIDQGMLTKRLHACKAKVLTFMRLNLFFMLINIHFFLEADQI